MGSPGAATLAYLTVPGPVPGRPGVNRGTHRPLRPREQAGQHGVVRYRSLPLGERVTIALVLATLVVAGIVLFAMSM
jgi:hypothetical protein